MRRYIVGGIVTVFGLFMAMADQTSAHVMIRDTSGSVGGILHVTPDDDPVAGQTATLFLDVQDGRSLLRDAGKLEIKEGDTGAVDTIAVTSEEGTVIGEYVFPGRGIYQLRYDIPTEQGQLTFEYTIRVARGEGGRAQADRQRHGWAEAVLIGSGVGLTVLIVVGWNHRSTIWRRSVF